jgi:hypothetical protein
MATGINTGGLWFGVGITIYLETPASEQLGSESLRMPSAF